MGHGIVKLYCFNVSIERCRGTLFCARCPGTHQIPFRAGSFTFMTYEDMTPLAPVIHGQVRWYYKWELLQITGRYIPGSIRNKRGKG
jgi:hypothetical protein